MGYITRKYPSNFNTEPLAVKIIVIIYLILHVVASKRDGAINDANALA